MLKNIARLEAKVGEKVYQLLCDNDSPLNELKDALFQFLKYVGQIEDAVKAQKEQAEAEKSAEEPKKDQIG